MKNKFLIGCNYWASNAGADMWRDWDEAAVIEDLDILSDNGIEIVRVFPNWRDFQPIMPIFGGVGNILRYAMEGEKEPENPYWLDPVMLDRFSRFCDLCYERNIKIMVGLVTGWMSGRTFIPSLLYGKDLLTDPTALLFEQRLIRGIVTLFRDKKAIFAWDLGNEVYALQITDNSDVTANWTAMMTANIRACDNTRPVISAADCSVQNSDGYGNWKIEAEAEFCDMLVRHPYPFWSQYGYKDYTKNFRTMIHATAQGKYFSNIGDKPCMLEEIGTMGPMICSDEIAADFIRVNSLSAWANGMTGLLWWCANDQTNLSSVPYDENMCELELGMIYENRKPKPVLKEVKKIRDILANVDFELPKAQEDAVLIVSGERDCWARAYSAYSVAKQAGLNVRFTTGEKPLPDSDTYILPSVSGHYIMRRNIYLDLKQRVYNGATLYISNQSGILAEFCELTGMKVIDSCNTNDDLKVTTDNYTIEFKRTRRYNIQPETAEVLAYDSLGIPAICVNNYGKGKVYYVNFPLEMGAIDENNAFDKERHKVYREIFKDKLNELEIRTDNQYISITRHKQADGSMICVAINYSENTQKCEFVINENYEITDAYYGKREEIAPFDACIFKLENREV